MLPIFSWSPLDNPTTFSKKVQFGPLLGLEPFWKLLSFLSREPTFCYQHHDWAVSPPQATLICLPQLAWWGKKGSEKGWDRLPPLGRA